jgi:hypothetical protein
MFLKDQAARNPGDIGNLFANFFQEVYVKDDESSNMIDMPNLEQNPPKVSLIQFTESDIVEVILDLDEQKGPGPDGISPLILKKLALAVSTP